MVINYLKTALRNIRKHKGFSLINIAGLSVGMACCMVIFLYVFSELSYDRYHEDSDRIHRVAMWWKVPSGEYQSAGINAGLAQELSDNFARIENAARYMPIHDRIVGHGNSFFYEDRIGYADPEIFEIFKIPFIAGDPQSALEKPWTVVITQRIAEKYFGRQNPLGKTLEIKEGPARGVRSMSSPDSDYIDFEITGIVENPPSNTHFKYSILVSSKQLKLNVLRSSWHDRGTYTYVKLAPGTDAHDFERQISQLAVDHVGKQLKAWGQERRYFLQPLTSIHFQSRLRGELEVPGNRIYIVVYSLIGLLVLLIGCLNFINLSNARSVYRSREVGIRKVLGAGRFQLVRQFLGESMILTAFASGLSVLICGILLTPFNETAGTTLSVARLAHPPVLLSIFGLVIAVGLASGGYPASLMTAFNPASVLKGSAGSGTRGSSMIRVMVVLQFSISIFFIIGTLAVFQQLKYMKGRSLGFEKEQKFVVPFRYNSAFSRNFENLKNEFMKHHAVTGAAASSSVPGRRLAEGYLSRTEAINTPAETLDYLAVDFDFISQYGIEMAVGEALSENTVQNSILINESAVRFLGYHSQEEALGKTWYMNWYDGGKIATEIVGVTRNFYHQGMFEEVAPLFMIHAPFDFDTLTLTVEAGSLGEAVSYIENRWKILYPALPFEGYFLDEDFDLLYRAEEQMGKLLGIVSGLGLVISVLGLLGLAAFMTQRRTKEIGIRKILGASVSNIAVMISKSFSLWVLMANVFAWPMAYLAIDLWLQNFAYRVDVAPGLFLTAAAISLSGANLAVSFHVFKTALSNPVESLRYE